MAGLAPATQRARVYGRSRLIGSRTLACWMAGSEAGHGEMFAIALSALVASASLHSAAFAQTTGDVPGGITLVPGTVVTPQIGGSAATGRVPLAGLPGSPGVRNFDPQLAPPAVPDTASQYRVAPYPPIKPPYTNQSTLPQELQTMPNAANSGPSPFGPPPVDICPSGTLTANGMC